MNKLNKRGQSGKLLSVVFVVLLVSVLAGVIFGSDGLNSTGFTSNAPSWLVTLLPIVVGIGIARMVMRSS